MSIASLAFGTSFTPRLSVFYHSPSAALYRLLRTTFFIVPFAVWFSKIAASTAPHLKLFMGLAIFLHLCPPPALSGRARCTSPSALFVSERHLKHTKIDPEFKNSSCTLSQWAVCYGLSLALGTYRRGRCVYR